MPFLLRVLKRLIVGVLLVAALGLVLLVLGAVVPHPDVARDTASAAPARQILVVSTEFHTDIAVPLTPETRAAFAFLDGTGLPLDAANAAWLLFGWGGRSFYLETPTLADIRPGPLFRAATIDASVMHVDVLGAVAPGHPAVTALGVSEEGFAQLVHSIANSFVHRDGAAIPIAEAGFGSTDRFYEAEGAFNLFVGCNLWTARALRAAGLTTGVWTPFPLSLTLSLRLFNPDRVS